MCVTLEPEKFDEMMRLAKEKAKAKSAKKATGAKRRTGLSRLLASWTKAAKPSVVATPIKQ